MILLGSGCRLGHSGPARGGRRAAYHWPSVRRRQCPAEPTRRNPHPITTISRQARGAIADDQKHILLIALFIISALVVALVQAFWYPMALAD